MERIKIINWLDKMIERIEGFNKNIVLYEGNDYRDNIEAIPVAYNYVDHKSFIHIAHGIDKIADALGVEIVKSDESENLEKLGFIYKNTEIFQLNIKKIKKEIRNELI